MLLQAAKVRTAVQPWERSSRRHAARVVVTAVPIIICNVVAVSGQYAFIREHLAWPLAGDLLFAAGLEGIAIFLAYMAHEALMAEDSSLRLRLGSYGAGLLAGAMNYSHYSADGRPTFAAVGTGLMSAASPVLWGIYSRRQSRDVLMEKGLIERRALKLGTTRWAWHPLRSFRVMFQATWTGERCPQDAIEQYEHGPQDPEPEKPKPETRTRLQSVPRKQGGRVRKLSSYGRKIKAAEAYIAVEQNKGHLPSAREVQRVTGVGRERAKLLLEAASDTKQEAAHG